MRALGRHDFLAASMLILSIIGAILVLPLAVFKPIAYLNSPWRKPLIGSLLALICIAGTSAAIFPRKCIKVTHRSADREKAKSGNVAFQKVAIDFKGHHPNCGKFEIHVVHMRGREYCAACIGLSLGALIVLAGSLLYFFIGCSVMENFGLWAIFAGQIGVTLGLFQFKSRKFMRLALNTIFVIACFLILAGADSVAGNLLLDLYIISLILYLLFTRILLSRWDHMRTCGKCGFSCI